MITEKDKDPERSERYRGQVLGKENEAPTPFPGVFLPQIFTYASIGSPPLLGLGGASLQSHD